MNIDLSAFDLEKIVRKEAVMLNTKALTTIEYCCRLAQQHNMFIGITGETGYGKSTSFDYFRKNNSNVFQVTIEKSMNSADLYFDLANQLGIKGLDLNKTRLNPLIRSVSYTLNNNSHQNLIILDEAGKFTPRKLLFLHELRDATKESTGIIVAGPQYFRTKIESWANEQREGIPELYRRIQDWVTVDKPSKAEMTMLCKESGVKAPDYVKALIAESANLGDLSNKILQAKLYVLQELQSDAESTEQSNTA